jgi:ATP-dependent DNA helicase RecG
VNNNSTHTIDYSAVSQDSSILEHYGLNELNFESVKSYRQRFAAVKPNHPWNGLEMKEFLYKIGAWGKIRNTSKEGLTLAGLLMFSEERMITEVLPQYFLEYRENLGDIINAEWSHRFTSQDGTWSGNVYDFYFKAMDRLTKEISDESAEIIASSVHEALMNTIVHADYYGEGGIVIEKETYAFRFSNPGLLRTSVEQVFQGGISNLRNPNLFKMFILIDLCKRAGSGLRNIEAAANQLHWHAPSLLQDQDSDRTTLIMRVSPLQNEDNAAETEQETVHEEVFWREIDAEVDSYNKEENSVNNDIYSYNSEFNSINNENNSINIGFNSVNNGINSYNSEFNSINNENNSGNKDERSCNNETENTVELPVIEEEANQSEEIYAEQEEEENTEEELWRIAELARKKKRLSPSVMEEIILQLCAKRPLMLKEFAYLLERTPDGLRNNYLAKLLDKGKIKLKYPDQVNHPKQAYMIVK